MVDLRQDRKDLNKAKREATQAEHQRVFENMNSPQDIVLRYKNQVWERKCHTWPGGFRWGRWKCTWC